MTEMNLSFSIEKGDILKMNDVWWQVEEFDGFGNSVDMRPYNGAPIQCFEKKELEESIEYSGSFQYVGKEYSDVVEF